MHLIIPILSLSIGILLPACTLDSEPDKFGKSITIPSGMKVSEPAENFDELGGRAVDTLTEKIIAAFSAKHIAHTQTGISTDLGVLNEFGTANRQKLIQYLAASPRWFVTEEAGKAYAYRRLVVQGRWKNLLNGFYSSSRIIPSSKFNFQTRIVIGFDGPIFAGPFERKGILTTGQISSGDAKIRVVEDKAYGQGKESYFVLQSSRASIEIFEQSPIEARPITQLAIAELRRELEAALAATSIATASRQGIHHKGKSEIQLAKGDQGGIYHARAFVNPGEGGRVYLKVFEATQNTPLSANRIEPRSISRIGWSKNPDEKFRYQSEITVYEGDWGTFYPGRFELWFIPDLSGEERKLVDKVFRIEGWMR